MGRTKPLKRSKRLSTMTQKMRGKYKEKNTGSNKPKLGRINDPNRIRPKGATHLRDRATIKRLKMYNCRPIRDKRGRIIREKFMRYDTDSPVSRIHPDRRWFGNTKIISQKQLQLFRSEMTKSIRDPFQIVLKSKKIPYGLLNTDAKQTNRMKLLQIEPFQQVFGPKQQRKKPKLKANSLETLANRAVIKHDNYDNQMDEDTIEAKTKHKSSFIRGIEKEQIFLSGQSQRIKSELYKVIDSSDVLLQILDARDPMGTRSPHIEKYIQTNCNHKHIILILNKIDLIPTWCTKRWIKILSKEYPVIAFKASKFQKHSTTPSFGKSALISLLRQFRLLYGKSKRTISIGLFGYPNVGKSSIINCIVGKKACSVAPIPGQTKVWQYVSLFNKFYLIDCPGVVYPREGDNMISAILRSVVRVQNIENCEEYVEYILDRVRKQYLQTMYEIEDWTDSFDFMAQIAKRSGKLLKGGEPDYHNVAVMILNDWQRGKLPWFVSPPFEDDLEYQYKLRMETQKIEDELKAFIEDEVIEYEPIDTMNGQRNVNNLNEINHELSMAHEFDRNDMDEDAFRKDIEMRERQIEDGNEECAVEKIYKEMSSEEKLEFDNIVVSNPLNLANDDPLILQAKWKKWKK